MMKAENIEQRITTNGEELVILSRLNFHIEKGEFVAFLANKGAGKTSLIKMLGLLTPIKTGELLIHNTRISQLTDDERTAFRIRHIGIVLKDCWLIDELTIYENVELPLIYLNVDKDNRKRRVENILAQLNLSHRENNYPGQVPMELLKQVELARALVIQPKVILVDEPAANLSNNGYEDFMKGLEEANKMGITIVITSDKNQDIKFIHRSLLLQNGEIVG